MNNFALRLEKVFVEFYNKKAKIWNIGTNVYNTWVLLNKYLLEKSIKNIAQIKIDEIKNPNNGKKYKNKPTKYGIIKANGINITPAKGKKHFGWSEAGIRQFLQEGSAMHIIMFNEKNKVFNNFNVTAEFNNVCSNIDQNWWLNKIKNLILHSLTSKQKHIVNLGFTLFYVLVCKLFPTIFDNFKNNFVVEHKVGRAKTIKWWKIKNKKITILKANIMYSEKNTYKGLADVILANKNSKEIFQKIFDEIYNIVFNENKENINENEIINNDDKEIEIILDKLNGERNKFKDNLLENHLKISNSKIIPIDLKNNGKNIYVPIEVVDAAHIYGYKEIKNTIITNYYNKSLNDEIKNKCFEDVKNPNNGLLLSCNLHRAFDRRLFNFDINGKVIFNEEDRESIKKLDIESAEINQEIFNERMKEFILKR